MSVLPWEQLPIQLNYDIVRKPPIATLIIILLLLNCGVARYQLVYTFMNCPSSLSLIQYLLACQLNTSSDFKKEHID